MNLQIPKRPIYLECGDMSPLSHCATCRAVPKRGHVRALQIRAGFTLIEMLVVISIIGILAAITLPTLNSFRPDQGGVASAQLMADVGRARQLAISQHTTVYMVFMPMLSADSQFTALYNSATPADKAQINPLLDKQLTSYTYISLRSIGDQPGRPTARYLSNWKTLPDGAFIPYWKFPQPDFGPNPDPTLIQRIYTNTINGPKLAFSIPVFLKSSKLPFPTTENPIQIAGKNQPYLWMPYIAFDYLGRLVDDSGNFQQPVADTQNQGYQVLPGLIPISKGAVLLPRDATRAVVLNGVPATNENPPGNTTNSYNIVNVDWLTGRPHIEHPEVQ